MQRTWSALLGVGLGIALLLAGCKKEGGSSAIEALLPKGVAAQLSGDLQIFAEELPGDVQAFGYVDFGRSLESMTKAGQMAEYRTLYEDFAEMIQRRWGVDLQKLSGVGFVVHQKQPLFLAVAPSTPPKAGELTSDLMIGKLGRLTVIGKPDAVAALLASAKQGKHLYQTRPAWLRNALVRAAGNAVFASGDVETFLAEAPPQARAQLGDLTDATVTVGASGAAVTVTCKPGTVEKVRGLVEGGLGMARQLVAMQSAKLPADQPGPLLAVLLRHYSQAFFQSLEQKVSGDELSLKLGWHAPVLPPFAPAPMSERVIVPGEMAVAQLNFGAPLLQLTVALTDVLKAPLDRAKLEQELAAELAKMIGTAGFDPRAATVSASPEGFAVSLHNAPMGPPQTQLIVPGDAVVAVTTKWGVAMASPSKSAQLLAALTTAGSPAPGLAEAKLLASEDEIFFRGFLDLTKIPGGVPLPGQFPTLHEVAALVGGDRFAADVVTEPGKGKAFVKALEGLPDLLTPGADEMYRNRKTVPVQQEALAIVQHYQRAQVKKAITPTAVNGDRVSFAMTYPRSQMRLMMAASGVGIMAAVAIPAFMSYQMRAQRALDAMPPMPSDDDILDGTADGVPMVEEPTQQQQP